MKNLERQKYLTILLKEAAKAYYQDSKEIMSNYEYDKLYDELLVLEKETGIILSDSVTQVVGYEIVSELEKKKHSRKMLSLDKTKDRENLKEWLGNKKGCLSWKLDGLTVVLTYENGVLKEAVTRGNGEIGEVITSNAKHFKGIPSKIPFLNRLVLRGEGLITYKNFEKVNSLLSEVESKYKNPRNLASGTIRQLNSEITAERGVDFYAFNLIEAENFFDKDGIFLETYYNHEDDIIGYNFNSFSSQLLWLQSLGFQVVENIGVTNGNLIPTIENMERFIQKNENEFPSDGLVLFYDDISYGRTLGETSKFPRNGMAFKWADEIAETTLREIEWSPSRTGLLNPVAIFDPVELEGTTVSRASVHNISILEEMKLNVGDKINVFKANMIIPQISENLTMSLENIRDIVPKICPLCGANTEIKKEKDSKTLVCLGEDCPAKHIGKFEHFVGRDAMNIVGLSSSKLEEMVRKGIIKEFSDLYLIEEKQKQLNIKLKMETDELEQEKLKELIMKAWEGWGEKSVENMFKSIETSRNIELSAFLYALGIENIGRSASKDIVKAFHFSLDEIINASKEEFLSIDGVGDTMADTLICYFDDYKNIDEINKLIKFISFKSPDLSNADTTFGGKTFVITGSLEHYPNRNALKDMIELKGGKVSGSVSAKTSYLINNDTTSNSGKNKKAKELGVPIISEDEFIKLL